jgi:hypothetical protein
MKSLTNSTNSTSPRSLEGAIYPRNSFISDYLDYGREQEESADSYLIGAVLPVIGAVLARQVYLPWGDRKVYPNVFTMLAGKPGDRKSSAINLAERLARRVLSPNRFLPASCSAEALFDEYDESRGGSPDKLFIADDANPVLGTWKKTSYGERVGQRFLTLYDCQGLDEAFRNNGKDPNQPVSCPHHRRISETSTSLVFGATFNICQFQGHELRSGLQRRFLYYVAERHGRLIAFPPISNPEREGGLAGQLSKLSKLHVPCELSDEAKSIWGRYQEQNRQQLQKSTDDAHSSRLNGAPHSVLKIAMLFGASVWAHGTDETWDGVIHREPLELAIQHVDQCLEAAKRLDTLSERAVIKGDADLLLAKVRNDFGSQATGGWIHRTKTQLTSKYAHHSSRLSGWTPDYIYQRLIPSLMKQELATVEEQSGKKTIYGFRVEDP